MWGEGCHCEAVRQLELQGRSCKDGATQELVQSRQLLS